jgi:hypothetical protein
VSHLRFRPSSVPADLRPSSRHRRPRVSRLSPLGPLLGRRPQQHCRWQHRWPFAARCQAFTGSEPPGCQAYAAEAPGEQASPATSP